MRSGCGYGFVLLLPVDFQKVDFEKVELDFGSNCRLRVLLFGEDSTEPVHLA